jgi:hypothetical protein
MEYNTHLRDGYVDNLHPAQVGIESADIRAWFLVRLPWVSANISDLFPRQHHVHQFFFVGETARTTRLG